MDMNILINIKILHSNSSFPLTTMKIPKLLAAALAAMAIGGALDARASTITYSIRSITDSTFLNMHDY